MARTIKQIQDEIISVKNGTAALSGLTSPSQTAIWLAWTYVVAVCIWTLEKLYDLHILSVKNTLATDKSHTLRWYQNKALNFQYGSALPDGDDVYDNTLLTAAQIAAQKIIAQAAAAEDNGIVTVKAAKEISGELEPLVVAEYNAFASYMQELKDAGVNLQVISFSGDKLKVTLQIEYDPQVINGDGARVDGSDAAPVKNAIKNYLRNLPFNGIFRVDKMIDALQAVEGVIIPTALQVQAAKYDVLNFSNIQVKYQPYSGYLRIYNDADLTVTYIPTT